MATGVASWSTTAANNATADANVNWAEGQAPSTVNNSARAEMASVALYRDDVEGSLVTGGTSTAYTATSSQGFASLAALDGNMLRLRVPQLGEKLVLEYFVVIEPLSESNRSNWLLEDAPDIYLAGCLHEAFSYIRDDDRTAFWMNKRDMTIQEFIDEDAESKTPTEQPLVMRNS